MNLCRLRQPAEVIDRPDEHAQREVLIATLKLILDRLRHVPCRHPGPGGPADLAQEATDLWLAAAREFSDPSLTEATPVPVQDHLAELGAALTNQLVRTQRPFGDVSLESHVFDSNYY